MTQFDGDSARVAERLFAEAETMPDTLSRYETLERAARSADAAGLTELGVRSRLDMIKVCYELRSYLLMLAPFSWCVTVQDREPAAFTELSQLRLRWMTKWVINGLIRDPRFSLAQIESALQDMENRFRQDGYSAQPVHGLRLHLAQHVGDREAADRHFVQWLAAEGDQLSDCAACVVSRQVSYLVYRGRHEEAVQHAESVLRQEISCAAQPQGILTTLLTALVATGKVDLAREAHLRAYRSLRDDPSDDFALHLRFLATTGNIERGLDILGRHLDLVHEPTDPAATLVVHACAALLLRRLDPHRLATTELTLPAGVRVAERVVTAGRLLAELEQSALDTAAAFDRRNGTSSKSDWVHETLNQPDRTPVPLAIPDRPAPAVTGGPTWTPVDQAAEFAVLDPTELAVAAIEAYDRGDFLTGHRLLSGLPADLDQVLPEPVALLIGARRALLSDSKSTQDSDAETERVVAEVLERLVELGERGPAVRYRYRLALLCDQRHEHERAVALADQAVREAVELGHADLEVVARLTLSKICPERAEAELAAAQAVAEQRSPRQLHTVAVRRAELRHEAGDHAGVLEVLEPLLDAAPDSVSEADRCGALNRAAKAAVELGTCELALRHCRALVELTATAPGPWHASALLDQANTICWFDQEEGRLAELLAAVSGCRDQLSDVDTANACYLLGGGYLTHGRPVEAAETLEEALRLVEHDAPPDLLLSIHYRLGICCGRLGEHKAAMDHLSTAMALLPESDLLRRAQLLSSLGTASTDLGDLAASHRHYSAAAAILQQLDRPLEAARMLMRLAGDIGDQDTVPDDDSDQGVSAALEALAAGLDLIPAGQPELTAELIATRAYVLARAERFAEAVSDNQAAERLAAQLGELRWQVFLVGRSARLYLRLGELTAADREARRAATLLPADADQPGVAQVLRVLADVLTAQDRPVDRDPLVRSLSAMLED